MAIYTVSTFSALDERDFAQQLVNQLDANTAWSLVRTDVDQPEAGRDLYALYNTVHGFHIRVSSRAQYLGNSNIYGPTIQPFLNLDAGQPLYPNHPTMIKDDSTSYTKYTAGTQVFYYSFSGTETVFPITATLLANTANADFYLFLEFSTNENQVFACLVFDELAELKNGATRTHQTIAFHNGRVVNSTNSNDYVAVYRPVRVYSDGKYSGFLYQADDPTKIEEEQDLTNPFKVFSPVNVYASNISSVFPSYAINGIGAVGCLRFASNGFLPNTNQNANREIFDSVSLPDVFWHWQTRKSPKDDIQYGSKIYRHFGNFPNNIAGNLPFSIGGGFLVRIG